MKTTHKTYKCFGWIFILLSNFTLHSIMFSVLDIHWFSQLLLALSVFISLIPLVTFLILLFFSEPKLTDFQHSRLERRKNLAFKLLKSFYWKIFIQHWIPFFGFFSSLKLNNLETPLPSAYYSLISTLRSQVS